MRIVAGALLIVACWTVPAAAKEPQSAAEAVGLTVAEDGTVRASLQQADLPLVLRAFAEVGRFQLVLDPEVRGSVTAELDGVPLDRALAAILRTHGLAAEIDGRLWWGDRPPPSGRAGSVLSVRPLRRR